MKIIYIVLLLSAMAGNLFAQSNKVIDYTANEKIILSKLSTNTLVSKYSPVFIYRSTDNGQNGSLAGSGSLYVENGVTNIVTAEHLFDKAMGKQVFVYRPLRPYETYWTFPIETVEKKGSDIVSQTNSAPDVAILKCGSLKTIDCFSEESVTGRMFTVNYNRERAGKVLTSLLTGKCFPVFGTITESNNQSVNLLVIEYTSIHGESGTGFVDQKDNLYVLCSHYPEDMSTAPKPFVNMFGTTNELSMLYGPIPLHK